MKIHHDTIQVTTNAAFVKSKDLTVATENLGHVLYLLTEIYSDREASVVRETVANAIDSHRAAGQIKPVEVTFPNHLNPSFIVKDYGLGMSGQELDEVYRKYGKSTKEGVDNQLGAFGIGAKAPLSLSSSFTVNAVKDGKRNIVIISKDEDDKTKMNFLPEQDTDEPNGVTVTVPVAKPREFDRVMKSPIFLGYKPGDLLVNGKQPSSIHDSAAYKALDGFGWYEFGDKIADRGYSPDMRVLLDAVPYGVPAEQAEELLKDFRDIAPMRTIMQRIVLALPNGSVKVTPNRENLVYSDYTKNAIKGILAKAVPLMLAHASRLIEDAPDRKAAVRAANSLRNQGLLPVGDITWRGETFATLGAGDRGQYVHTYASAEVERKQEDPERLHYAKGHIPRNGYKVRVTREHGSNLLHHFASSRRFILITEATKKVDGAFASDAFLSTWFASTGIQPNHYDAIGIYTTTRKAADLSPWLTALAEQVITAEQVIAAARANTVTRKRAAVKRDDTFTLTIASKNRREKMEMLTTVTPDKVDPELKYVIAQATGPTTPKTYENAVYAYFRAINSGRYINGTDNLMRAAINKGYAFVIVPASAKRQQYIDALPNVHDIDEAFAEVFAFEATDVEQEYFAYGIKHGRAFRYSNHFDTRPLYKGKGLIEQVKDATTRDYLALFRGPHAAAQHVTAMIDLWSTHGSNADILKTTGPKTRAAVKKIKAAAKRDARIYPLLLNGIPDGAEQDAVDYINLTDSKRAAN